MTELRRTYERYWAARLADAGRATEGSSSLNEIFESVGSVLGEGKRLLDVGCGVGTLLDLVGAKFQAVHGCDLSETALREARQRGVLSVCADLNRSLLPYQDRSFECVTCLEVIEHVFDPLSLLRELHRILKDKGQLVLTTPNIRYFRNVLTLVWHGRFPHTTMDTFVWGGGHLHYFTQRDLKHLLTEAGFTDCCFVANPEQFHRSWKRWLLAKLTGLDWFAEWICGGITVSARKK